jgi:hypothetical protein
MHPVQLIQSLINAENIQKASQVTFKPGQYLYGRVEKVLPNHTAVIQIGNMKLMAHLQTDVSAKDHYWFEVRSNSKEGIQLKVVEAFGQTHSAQQLLDSFQLPNTKQNVKLLQYFLANNLPFSKEQLKAAAAWVGNQSDISIDLNALEWMIKRDLPFTKQTFQSLVAVQDSHSFTMQLQELGTYLDQPKFDSMKTLQPLKDMIANLAGNQTIDEIPSGSDMKQMLKNLVQSLGLEYENNLQLLPKEMKNSIESLQSLKPLLLGAMNELGTSGKEVEPILNRLTGMQLISQDPGGPLQQMVLQLPFTFGNKQSDITLQWNGRKTSKGQIDPDYCRILFYLDLQSINQTVIDMQVQNKIIHVSIINDEKEISPIISALTPSLKENLERIGYKLSFIHSAPSTDKRKLDQHSMNLGELSTEFYRRVDIKI